MAGSSALLDYLLDQLGSLGQARGRAMFGGHGLYLDGLFIAIIDDETLYLKADEASRPDFEAAGMEPFTYASRGRRIALSFWQAPAEVIEDPQELQRWVAAAVRAAGRARTSPAPRRRKPAR
jgi:DNA transformation protein